MCLFAGGTTGKRREMGKSCWEAGEFDGGRATGTVLGEGVPGKLGLTAAEFMIPRTSAALPLLPICPGQWW